jgi:hypothetical protein
MRNVAGGYPALSIHLIANGGAECLEDRPGGLFQIPQTQRWCFFILGAQGGDGTRCGIRIEFYLLFGLIDDPRRIPDIRKLLDGLWAFTFGLKATNNIDTNSHRALETIISLDLPDDREKPAVSTPEAIQRILTTLRPA